MTGPDTAAAPAASRYAAAALLRDGSSISIRAIRPDDKERLQRHFAALGSESRYFRFFGFKKALSEQELRFFTEPDFVGHVGLVGLRLLHGDEEIVGVARYTPCGEKAAAPHRAEFAVAVADAWQGRGVGTALLEHLVQVALAGGITELRGDVLGGNTRMRDMLRGLGCMLQGSGVGAVITFTLATDASEGLAQASDRRTWPAAAESLRGLLSPRSVAVVGASRRPGTIGHALVANLREHGFTGPVYAVNPREGLIQGLPTYRSLGEVPSPVDLVVVAVPARGGRGGGRPGGREGRPRRGGDLGRLRRDLGGGAPRPGRASATWSARRACAWSGPNCMGVLNTDPGRVHQRDLRADRPGPPGNVGMPDPERRARAGGARLRARARASACPASSRSATRPTCRATTCSRTGRTTRAPR